MQTEIVRLFRYLSPSPFEAMFGEGDFFPHMEG